MPFLRWLPKFRFALRTGLVGKIKSGRHPIPRPHRPDYKGLQAEATTCRNPGSVACLGLFFVTVKARFSARTVFARVCV
jgi:hypothetical protein